MIRGFIRVWLSVFNAPPDAPILLLFYPFHTGFFLLYPPPPPSAIKEVEGGILVSPCSSVRLSVCRQNRVRCVSSTVLAALISYLHSVTSYQQTSEGVSCIEFCDESQNLNFGNFLKFAPIIMSCVHVMWMLKVDCLSESILQQLLIFYDDTSG